MFLRSTTRKKDGKEHRYYSVVESVRGGPGARPHQRTLLYLGEINSEQQAQWAKAIEVFDPENHTQQTFSLFPSDHALPPGLATPALQIRLDQYELTRPRQYGACWLGCELWRSLNFDSFWSPKLGVSREGTDWTSLLEVSVIYRLVAPGSEWRLHRQWYDQSAMKDLLAERLQWGGKDQLYHVLDKLLAHRDALFTHLQERWQDLFGVKYDVLLYDLTSTYFEGEAEENPKAQRGYSRDHRPDCKQIVIALVVTPEGFPLAYETLPGNTQDKSTLLECVEKIEAKYGKAQRIWIMDRGIPTEAQLEEIRHTYPQLKYLVGNATFAHQGDPARLGEAGVDENPRYRRGEKFHPLRRIIRRGQEPRPAVEGNRHATAAAGQTPARAAQNAPGEIPGSAPDAGGSSALGRQERQELCHPSTTQGR